MKNNNLTMKKRPLSITLIIIWMGYMILRTFGNLINSSRFELSKAIMGTTFTLIYYIFDVLILLAFVALITFFVKKKRNVWKYFIFLIIILIFETIADFFFIDEVLPYAPTDLASMPFMTGYLYAFLGVIMLFYVTLIYVIYKKRGYFER